MHRLEIVHEFKGHLEMTPS